ncbi:hypothetical protein PMAYCL1PPCAC_02492 [Pristionchus mayeri]|uniref:EGF-like domain-containing protein n=1 Tax=Pristionchus mayeri TaxID=1317129 RepID=A0AAN5C6Z8_9BILA|nr:hypothetical protein PMAYCL1PPCAC_02492 [Pristionchus mayeri]
MEASPLTDDQLLNGVASRLVFKGSPCDSYPCWNEGTCSSPSNSSSFSCLCTDPFIGDQCQYRIGSLCPMANCSTDRSFCSFNGLFFNCTTHIVKDLFSSCLSTPCSNGGSCEEREGGLHRCSCPLPFTGPLCQYELSSSPSFDWSTVEISLVFVLLFLVLFVFLLICCSGNIGFYVSLPSKRYTRWDEDGEEEEDDHQIALGPVKRSHLRISQTSETLLEEEETSRTPNEIVHL